MGLKRYMVALYMSVMTMTLVSCNLLVANPSPATYGSKVVYQQGQRVVFPDFTLEFVGTRREASPQYPRGFTFYDFTVTQGALKQTVSWTSGTGLIGPLDFQVNDKQFVLERVMSSKLGKLEENELVVWAAESKPTATTIPTRASQATSVISTPLVAPTRAPVTPTTVGTPVAPSAPTTSSMPVNGINAHLNEPFTLGWSQWATIAEANNLRVFFTSILEDTRCALDINCFQAGNVRVAVTIESNGKLARFDLSTRPNDYRRLGSFNGYLVQFVDIAPARERAAVSIQPIEYRVKLMVTRGSLETTQARINEPFTLKLGQTIALADLDTQVTFESVTQDSRCPTRAACATSGEAMVALVINRAGKTERLTLGTTLANMSKRSTLFDSAGIALNALTPYPQQEFASKEITPSEYQVTLVVMNYISAAPTPRTTTTATISCPDLSRGDASEILGEAIQDQPAHLSLFVPPTPTEYLGSLCGYRSVAFSSQRTAINGLPFVFPIMAKFDRAVIAGKINAQQRTEQLLSVVGVIDAAGSRGASTLYNKLLVAYAAGTWSRDWLNEMPDTARGKASVRVNKVSGLGDNAISVWREFEDGRYAALVALKGETLYVVAALTTVQRTEDNTFAAMTPALQKMVR